MMRRTGFVALLATLGPLALPGPHPTAVQERQTTPQENASPRVNIAQSVGPPGGIVAVPIQLSGVESGQIGKLTLTLRFPSNKLTFTKVEVGGLGDSVGAVGTTEMHRRGDETLLEVTITTPEKEGARAPIPDGPIAQLMFRVAKDLKPETVIPLTLQAAGVGTKAGAEPVKVSARAGEIIVGNPSVISCFFYMH